MSFSGVFQHAIDAKGRTSLPSRFRELLAAESADRLIVTTDLMDPCLFAFTPAHWKKITDKVADFKIFDQKSRLLMRSFIAPAQECSVDKLGRILIPPTLREHAGLGEEITWAGMIARIEIWSPAKWAEQQEAGKNAARSPETQAEMSEQLSALL